MTNAVDLSHVNRTNKPFKIISLNPRERLMEFKIIEECI